MLGRLNAALNQTANMDKCIEDVSEHFVYLPKKSTVNAQDIPFFLSTRLEVAASEESLQQSTGEIAITLGDDPIQVLSKYESRAAQLVQEYENDMTRF